MQVKLFINPRLHAQVETGYTSLSNNQIEIKGCVSVADMKVNILIHASTIEIAKNDRNSSFFSFDHILKDYPQAVATILCELIADLDSRGENESSWFDFGFEMTTKEGNITLVESANDFDFVAYYNNLQSKKSSMIIDAGGMWGLLSVKPN